MRFSKSFIKTEKEPPKDATLKSHQYLVRGGFVTQVSSGIYNYMPLGKIVLDKVSSVIRDELNQANCLEVSLGFVTPSELWEQSGRFFKYGKELLRFSDRKDNSFVLGPTHEEMMVELVKNRVTSYKNLPLNLYQINLKFRDEARPRFGLLRCREFLMKDGYSFHSSIEDMRREFDLMEVTYSKIFKRLGLDFRVVDADSGAIGGSGSKEFMVLANSGEDTIVVCKNCNYSANLEASKRVKKEPPTEIPTGDFAKFHTPQVKTIEELVDFFKVDSYFFAKAIAKRAIYDDRDEVVLFFVRGCDSLNETKATNSVKANLLIDVSEEELKEAGLVAGYLGFIDVKCKVVVDNELQDSSYLITGANELNYHFVGVDISKYELNYFDLIDVVEGDTCISCGGELYHTKGIEVGHIFQLGTRYSEPLNANFLDEFGKSKPFIMGTFGIGVSRLLSAILEQKADDKGAVWNRETAPFLVDILISNTKDESQLEFAQNLYNSLNSKNISTILDDRDERFGSKIADFELIGFYLCVVVGKNLKDGVVQIIDRATLTKRDVNIANLEEEILKLL